MALRLQWSWCGPQTPATHASLGCVHPTRLVNREAPRGGRVLPLWLSHKGPKPGAASLFRARVHVCMCACSGSPREESCHWLSSHGGQFALRFLGSRALLGLGSQNSCPPRGGSRVASGDGVSLGPTRPG